MDLVEDGLVGLIRAEAEAREGWDEMREEISNFWSRNTISVLMQKKDGDT